MSTKPAKTSEQDEADNDAPAMPPGNWTNQPSMTDIGRMIAEGITEGFNKLQPKKVTFGEYQRRQPKKPVLLRPFTQNGYPVLLTQLSSEAIDMLNKVHRSGRYVNRKLEVIVRNADRDIADQSVELRYSNKTNEQRIDNAKHFGSLEDMLKKILIEQEALDLQEMDRQTRPASRVA